MNITISTLHVRPRYNPSQEVYVSGLLAGLAGRVPQDMRVTVLVTSENRGLFPLKSFAVRECPCIPSTTRRILWEQRALPRLLNTLGTDVYHGTGNMALLGFRGAQAVTVHLAVDFEVTGGWRHNAAVAWRRWIIGRSVRAARAVICASRYLSDRLLQIYQLGDEDARKMHVAPMGVDTDLFHPAQPGDGEDAFMLQKLGVSSPYVFGYADILGLKNVPRIIKAWAALRRDKKSLPVKLVLMGDPAGRTFARGHLASLGALRDDVHFLGFVTRRELAALYRGARALVFPSLAESFGLCLVEARAHKRRHGHARGGRRRRRTRGPARHGADSGRHGLAGER